VIRFIQHGPRAPFALLLALSGCFWTAPDNDAGQAAWVIDTLRVLHGRPPRSIGELDALVALANHNGREAVADLLLQDTELVDHWARVLTDDLGVERSGMHQMSRACYGDPMLTAAQQVALGLHLRSEPASKPFCVPAVAGDGDFEEPHETHRSPGPPYDPDDLARLGVPRPPSEAETEAMVRALEQAPPTPRAPEPGPPPDPEAWQAAIEQLPPPGLGGEELGYAHAMRLATSEDIPHEWTGTDEPVQPDPTQGDGRSSQPMVCPTFNMTDVIRAGILSKSLWVTWRAQLVPNQVFVDGYSADDLNRIPSERFWSGWLGRDPSCLPCHTSTYSTTEARPRNGDWDRFFPPTGPGGTSVDVEGSALTINMYGGPEEYGGTGDNYWWLRRLFRGDALRPGLNTNGLRPWNMAGVCTNLDGLYTDHSGFEPSLMGDTDWETAFGLLAPSDHVGVLDLIDQVPSIIGGFSLYSSSMLPEPSSGGDPAGGGTTFLNTCLSCHDLASPSGLQPALRDVVPTLPDWRLFQIIKSGSMSMPAQGGNLTDTEIRDVIAFFRTLPGYAYTGQRYADPEDGIAHLLAQLIVNRVVEDVQGAPLVLAHGFPRNEDAAALLDNLTRTFVGSGWSLQALLRQIVLSNAFNRNAPAETLSGVNGPYVYELPMMAFPWAGEPPNTTPPDDRNHNGTGDLVHRSNIPALLRHVHEALGWPEAPTIGDSLYAPIAYPSKTLQQDLGRPLGVERLTGLPVVELDNLLRWENQVASCYKPVAVRARDVQLAVGVTAPASGELTSADDWVDWIDVLAADTSLGTAEDVVRAIKVRLLTEADVSGDEAQRYSLLLGVANLGVPASSVTEDAMRRACGVLMTTPDFMLRRLPGVAPGSAPASEVCLEPQCTQDEFCSVYADLLWQLGYDLDCDGEVIIGPVEEQVPH
jgi:mono/diheme cytochrome c family protein